MKRRIFLGILSAAILMTGAIALPDTASAQLFNRDHLRCRARIAAATRRYYERQSRARRSCVKRIITGKIPPTIDCIKSEGDAILKRQLPQIRAIVGRIIPRSCSGVNLIFLGFPGICEDLSGAPPFDTRDLESCILGETDDVVMDLLSNSYPEIESFLRGAPGICVRGVADRTAGGVTQNLRSRMRCLVSQERRVTSGDVDCRGDIPPYGTGTTDRGTDQQIEASYVRVLSGIPSVCGGSDLVALGLNDMCDDATGEDFNLFDLKQCLLEDLRRSVPTLLDIAFPREPVCGDAVVAGDEECDNGQSNNSNTTPDACRVDCTLPSCGDAVRDPSNSEECDDGGLVDGDGCASDCTIERCGDGQINNAGTEECDDGAANSNTTPDACRTNCKSPRCGDSVTDTGEACDDGNNVSQDGCRADCGAIERCGDGVLQTGLGEQCDNGAGNSNTTPDACRANCTNPRCGDAVTDPSGNEECDDGNQNDSDGCSNICTVCGNGIVSGNEQCDNGVDNSDTTPDACRRSCMNPSCGDGVIDPSNAEVCDDNNTNPNDLCTDICLMATCGDGRRCTDPILCATGPGNGAEECDNGAANSDTTPNACRTNCANAGCGDDVTDSGEGCDGTSRGTCESNEACLESCECKHLCPGFGELTLFSGAGPECSSNGDCIVGTCDPGIGRCRTVTELDSGWNGIAHDADINDLTVTRGFLDCPATGPICGECNVVGVDPSAGNCRCSADNQKMCDSTFSTDPDCSFGTCGSRVCDKAPGVRTCSVDADCVDPVLGNLGSCVGRCSGNSDVLCRNDAVCQEANCLCYFGAPFPLSSGGTPACILNRFFEDISGTGNVDTGQGEISANLRAQVFLGDGNDQPCPFCGGSCAGSTSTLCQFDEECGANGPCVLDEIANDGERGGFCIDGEDAGKRCDVNSFNTSFPARSKAVGGGGYSLDCFPIVGKNVSGQGLRIKLTQTTGQTQLNSNVVCGANPAILCPCKQCTSDPTVPCNANSDCASQPGSCSIVTSASCTGDGDCLSVNAGNCATIGRCEGAFSIRCTTNGDCATANGGSCNASTCSSVGSGNAVNPNQCSDGQCNDAGGGEGTCNAGPTDRTCDGVIRANGDGILGCGTNADCSASVIGIDGGNCTLNKRRECFLDPIVATGVANPSAPVGAAAFCVPPTASAGINGAAGLPGPGRIANQATSITFCAEDPDSVYTPGVGGCPE